MTTPYTPKGYHSITPYLLVEEASEMIEFLQSVFDAIPVIISHHGNKIGHAALKIGDSMLEVADACEEWETTSAAIHSLCQRSIQLIVKPLTRLQQACVSLPTCSMVNGELRSKIPMGFSGTLRHKPKNFLLKSCTREQKNSKHNRPSSNNEQFRHHRLTLEYTY